MKAKMLLLASCATLLVAATGCTSFTTQAQMETTKSKELSIEKTEQYKDFSGVDWLGKDLILGSKVKKNLSKQQNPTDYEYEYVYSLNTKTKQEKLLVKEPTLPALTAVVSPDKKHIFYVNSNVKISEDGNMSGGTTGYISDMDGENRIKVTSKNEYLATEGRWVNNNELIFTVEKDGKFKTYLTDLNGKLIDLNISSSEPPIMDPIKKGENFYYLETGDKGIQELIELNSKTKKKRVITKDIYGFYPSKDFKQFIAIKAADPEKILGVDEGAMEDKLVMIDLNGKELLSIARGKQITALSWSPDNTHIAYTVIMDDINQKGKTFIYNINTKKSKEVSNKVSHETAWSEDGSKLLISDWTNRTTSVIQFK